MSKRTIVHFPPICSNCNERHDDMTGGDPEGDPGCDWDRMSGNGLGPAPRRFVLTRGSGSDVDAATAAEIAREVTGLARLYGIRL